MSVADRLQKLNARILEACVSASREPSSVRLLAVSKLQPSTKIRAAFAVGQIDFAENYVQETVAKQTELSDLNLRWHFIGRIQTNKVKALAKAGFAAIHSVDRVEVVQALHRASVGVQDIYLQFNVASEASKGGASDERALEDLLTAAMKCANLRVLGLMVMPPLETSVEESRGYFRRAHEVLARLRERAGSSSAHPLSELSMGTSHDFVQAIAEGATVVRIGIDVFGPREEEK